MAKQEVISTDAAVYVLCSGKPIYIKTADLCAMTGKTNQWIGQLTSQGILNKTSTPHGSLYEVTESISAYCAMLENRGGAKDDEDIKLEKQKLTADVGIKKAKSIKAMLEAQELQGKMHRSEDVAAMTADLIYEIRGALLALPGRLAVDVATMTDPAEAADAIRREVYKIMDELSAYTYDPAKYKERVRERHNMDVVDDIDDE